MSTPTPTNPLKAYRLSLGLTIDGLAQVAGVSRNLIIRNEQGTYPDPSPTLVDFFTYTTGSPSERGHLYEDYRGFQHQMRYLNGPNITPLLTPIPPVPFRPDSYPSHPFTLWRLESNVNLTQVAKSFCIQQHVLHKFENKVHLVESLPGQLVSALLEAGYDQQAIDNEQRWFRLYKEQLNKKAFVGTLGNYPEDS